MHRLNTTSEGEMLVDEAELPITRSQYCDALDALRAAPAHYLKEVGDQWRTPDLLFWGVNAMYGPLVLDLFADESNAKCPAWYSAEDNALTQDWAGRLIELGGAAFGNPPYSRSQYHEKQAITGMTHIMSYASAQREKGGRYVFLVKSATSETWWPEDADHVCFIRGRIGFDLPTWFKPANDKQKPTSAFFAGAIVVFDKSWRGERFSYIDRVALEAKGRASMALAQYAVGKQATAPIMDQPQTEQAETEIPLLQDEILAKSGIRSWACVVAAFGDKAEYTFAESKFGHTWAADSVDKPEFTPVKSETIATAQSLIIKQTAKQVLVGWLNGVDLGSATAREETIERMNSVYAEFIDTCPVTEFIDIVGSLDKASWFNSRLIRSHVREALSVAKQTLPESRIWPLEVGLVFERVEGVNHLNESQQNKLKAHINQLWLERTPSTEIITIASRLVSSMQGLAMREIIVDNFAGGGGASTGIEMAIGRSVDIAINHDENAVAMHRTNHPDTLHYCESVFDVSPGAATSGKPVGLTWFSPDCRHFSKAKGAKPVEKAIRGLAWIVLRWALDVGPRVMMLENVEEFKTWGPLLAAEMRPDPDRVGETFEAFVGMLTSGVPADHPALLECCEFLELSPDSEQAMRLITGLGYDVDYRELRACDYGAPTIRKRFFMVMRRDGQSIVWPAATHGDPKAPAVISGKLAPWRTAAECIDWSIPAPSIFDRKKSLAENTLKRIARGIQRFVIESASPFIVKCNHTTTKGKYDCFRGQALSEPLQTITKTHGYAIAVPHLTKFRTGATGQPVTEPVPTVTAGTSRRPGGNGHALGFVEAGLVPFLAGNGGSEYQAKPRPLINLLTPS